MPWPSMQSLGLLLLLCLAGSPSPVLGARFVARRAGAVLNLGPLHEHVARAAGPQLQKRASCGPDAGSCPDGLCCSVDGECGTADDYYCAGPDCQIEYSQGNCDAR